MANQLPANESLRLAALCEQMERLTSTLEHDLRGGLQAIIGYAELLAMEASGSLEPEHLRYLSFIKAGAQGVRDTMERGQARLHELILGSKPR
jgi:signal transduction histidine kinase